MIEKYALDNGMRVLLVPTKGTDTVSAIVLVRVGSRYEPAQINGASHFIEHMMFKGTRRRPTSQHITRTLDSIGASYNAFTDKHVTGYYVKVDKSHLELGIDLLDDMLFASKVDEVEMNKERGAIVEEINMYEDNPMYFINDLIEREVFKGGSLGWEIAGTTDIIKNMDRDEMHAFYQKYYQPSNMTLVVSGNINRKAKTWIASKFGKRKDKGFEREGFEPAVLEKAQKTPRARVQTKDTEQVQLAMAFPSFGVQDERNTALGLLSVILGGNMSSRLFAEVREKKGLAYFVQSYNGAYDDVGMFMVRAGLDKNRLELATKTITKELRKIKKSGVTARELRDAKKYIRGQVAIKMEDSFQRAQWYAREQVFQKRVKSPQAYLKKMDAITVSQVNAVAKDVFDFRKMSIAAVGPFKNETDLLTQSGFVK
jgi:predicted Zn-dependent peptidase